MILRKVIKDGNEFYEKISFEEATKLNKTELVFTSEDDEDDYDDYMDEKEEEREEEIEEYNDKIDDLEDDLSDLEDEIDDLDMDDNYESRKRILEEKKAKILDKISNLKKEKHIYINTKDNDVDVNFEFIFKGNEKNFYSLLPFLGKEKVEEIAKEKVKGNPKYKNIKLVCLLPFMSKEVVDHIFMEYLKDETKKDELIKFAPFVSKSSLDYLCDEYCKGNFQYIDINRFYPFMSKESISKIFDYFLTK